MTKQEFLDTLEQLLWDLKEVEKKEALQYYVDYFEDAGIGEDQDVVEEFGLPEKVAARIKVELTEEHSEYSEQGFEDVRFEENFRTMLEPSFKEEEGWEAVGENILQKRKDKIKEETSVNVWKIVAIAALVVLLGPVVLPLAFGMFLLVLGLALGAVALVAGLFLGGLGIVLSIALGGLISGVILILHGIIRMFTIPSLGAMSLGVGGLFLAAGILGSLALLWIVVKAIPWCFNGVVSLLGSIFHKGGKKG